jgi:protein polybromo-1
MKFVCFNSRLQKLLKNKYEDLDTESEEESSSESEPDSAVPTVVGTGNELSKKLRALYSDMIKFKNPQGIEYIEMFMERPSKKLYPDYYAVIKDPMDMKTINERIKADMYKTVEDFMQG